MNTIEKPTIDNDVQSCIIDNDVQPGIINSNLLEQFDSLITKISLFKVNLTAILKRGMSNSLRVRESRYP